VPGSGGSGPTGMGTRGAPKGGPACVEQMGGFIGALPQTTAGTGVDGAHTLQWDDRQAIDSSPFLCMSPIYLWTVGTIESYNMFWEILGNVRRGTQPSWLHAREAFVA